MWKFADNICIAYLEREISEELSNSKIKIKNSNTKVNNLTLNEIKYNRLPSCENKI